RLELGAADLGLELRGAQAALDVQPVVVRGVLDRDDATVEERVDERVPPHLLPERELPSTGCRAQYHVDEAVEGEHDDPRRGMDDDRLVPGPALEPEPAAEREHGRRGSRPYRDEAQRHPQPAGPRARLPRLDPYVGRQCTGARDHGP